LKYSLTAERFASRPTQNGVATMSAWVPCGQDWKRAPPRSQNVH